MEMDKFQFRKDVIPKLSGTARLDVGEIVAPLSSLVFYAGAQGFPPRNGRGVSAFSLIIPITS